MSIKLTSHAFSDGQTIPKKYTGDGEDLSPALAWDNVPEKTKSFALICDDPDAPRGDWVHWVVFNLPGDTRQLPEGAGKQDHQLPGGAHQGENDFHHHAYGGPAPPKGKPHRYYFRLFALDSTLDLQSGATKGQLLTAMKGHILAEGQLMGKYGR
jgi:Raf kinase inhibitor-like YbhB/YbcL family protein